MNIGDPVVRRVVWISDPPKYCDICQNDIGTSFVDGRTIYLHWGVMCDMCHEHVGIGLGVGKGQRYELQGSEFVKVEPKQR